MERINKICLIISLIIISFIVGTCVQPTSSNSYDKLDTVYNKIVLDSIEYNIIKKDSIIINYKKKIAYEIEQALNATDSAAIKQFKSLSAGK